MTIQSGQINNNNITKNCMQAKMFELIDKQVSYGKNMIKALDGVENRE